MSAPGFHPFPDQLAHIPRDRAAVVEASAGTGKTFLIEHLVVDRLLRGDARIEEMLVVTFTERAAAELRRRVQALVRKVAAAAPAPPDSAATAGWTVDDDARTRLAAAARQIDVAPISTIHAFCQRILTEQAFAGGRLLVQENVESRAAFAAAFAEVIRQELSVDPGLAPYLETYLTVRRSTAMLEQMLYRAHQLRVPFQPPFEPAAVEAAARALAAVDLGELLTAVVGHHSTVKAVRDRLQALHAAAQAFAARASVPGSGLPAFLAAVDPIVGSRKEGFDYLTENLAAGARARGPVVALADAAVSLETAVAALFLPRIAERVAARKRAAGLYDFDDMLALVRDALRGPRGGELIATLRARFKLAIVDEFQDTDPVQWEIFRTVFADSTAHPIYLVGDPKQSIYGFRGADVATYATACEAIAAPDERHQLTRNFRSTPAIVDAYNAILDADADPPFFSHGPLYRPVVAAGDSHAPETGAPPITLLRVTADEEITKLPMRAVREALARAIADEAAALVHAGQPAREIFVLTRTWREARTVEQALTSRGVAAVIYSQENLHASAEAAHVRDLLRAIGDPRDPGKRLRAWLTPFFGLSLGDLPAAAAAGADHPLHARLYAWHAAAARQPLGRLYPRILDESGVQLRELFLGESARRLVNYRHLFEMLANQDAQVARPLGDVVRRLAALCAGLTAPSPEEGDVERIESDRDAVQIMTMHKSKGLEADVVFVYGGFSPVQSRGVRLYTREGRRAAVVGKGRRQAIADAIRREAESEDQRLFYVALTRARQRLVLPFDGAVEAELGLEEAREELWKVNGGYAHVHRRLRALTAGGGASHHFAVREVPVDPRAPGDSLRPRATLGMFAWQPAPVPAVPAPPAAELARLARERLGPTYTSYSRIKQDEGGYRPPTEMRDDPEATLTPLGEDDLPGGARAGIFVHDLLERVPLETLRETPELEPWTARDDIRVLLETTLRRHGRDAAQLKPAARLAHAALTAALPVVGGALAGLAWAPRVIREMEFLFPFPEAAGGARRGFVKGYVDVVFEHEGRAYLIDWKTDRLSSWDPAAVEAHVAANYGLQERLYALALVRALRITDAAAYERRFGGTLYVFLRGLPGAVRSGRPTFAQIEDWQRQLSDELSEGGS